MTDTYRIRSPETWDQARKDYLDGDTAEQVCARYDLGSSNFHRRSRAEGWRRVDQDDPEPLDDDDDPDDLPEADLPVIADMALRRMAEAVRRGRVMEALRWQKLHQILSQQLAGQAEAALEAETDRTRARKAKAHEARIRAMLPPNATPLQRMEASLRAMMDGDDGLDLSDEMEEVEEVESLLSGTPDTDPLRYWPSTILAEAMAEAKAAAPVSNRAERRRAEKQMRKQE